jgi:type II secretory pathway pseudopilin PulG
MMRANVRKHFHQLASMDNTKRTIIGIIIGILIFVAALAAIGYSMRANRTRVMTEAADKAFEQMRTEANKTHPNDTTGEGIQQAATTMIEKSLAGETDATKKARLAGNTFSGYYYGNMRVRKAYCQEQGVDISPFTNAFADMHKTELRKARQAAKLTDEIIDTRFAILQPQMTKLISQDMRGIADDQKISLKEACQLFVEQGKELAAEMHVSKQQPSLAAALAAIP